MIACTQLATYYKYTNNLLCRENKTHAIITRAYNNFAFHPQRSTENGSPVSLVLLQQRSRSRIPCSKHSVCRRGDNDVPFRRMREKIGHSVLINQAISFEQFT